MYPATSAFIMPPTNSLDPQSCTCISEAVLAAIIKYVTEENHFKVSEMTANAVVDAVEAYLGPPKLSFKTFAFTFILMVLGAYLVEKLMRTAMRERNRGPKESPEFWQLCREELERDREQRRRLIQKGCYTRGTPRIVTSVDSFGVVRARSGSR